MKKMCVIVLTLLIQFFNIGNAQLFNVTKFMEYYQDHPFSSEQSAAHFMHFQQTASNVIRLVDSVDIQIATLPPLNYTKPGNDEFNAVMAATKIICNITSGLLDDFSDVLVLKSEERKK